MITISIAQQRLLHRNQAGVWRDYPVSTARLGRGQRRGSWQTPIGRHRIASLIGTGMPMNTVFIARKPCGIYDPERDDPQKDWILTRIIRLKGDQTGINRRGVHDTFDRYIYIHGTNDEASLGSPVSHGCIRMANRDIVELYRHLRLNEVVYIR